LSSFTAGGFSKPDLIWLIKTAVQYGPALAEAASLAAVLDAERDQFRYATRFNPSIGMHRDEIEYFSLGSIVKSISKVIAPVAKVVAPFIPGGSVISGIAGVIEGAGTSKPSTAPQGASIMTPTTTAPAGPTAPGAALVGSSDFVQLPRVSMGALEAARTANAIAKMSGAGAALAYLMTNYPPMKEVTAAIQMLNSGILMDNTQPSHDVRCDECEGKLARDEAFSGNFGRPGIFYRSSQITAELTDRLGPSVFGQVTLSDLPFRIEISRQYGKARAQIALAHEIAHVANQMLKLGMSHDKVHSLGVFYATEGLPALLAMKSV
jgi:hypothetical protein